MNHITRMMRSFSTTPTLEPAIQNLLADIRKIQINSRTQAPPTEFNSQPAADVEIGVTDNKTGVRKANLNDKEKAQVGDRGGGPYR
jgi:hypothetical protein